MPAQAAPATLLRDLTALLRHHGFTHLYATASPTEGVLSVAYGITVWTNGHTLCCHTPTHTIHLPTSTHAAARRLAGLTQSRSAPHHTAPTSPHTAEILTTDPPGDDAA